MNTSERGTTAREGRRGPSWSVRLRVEQRQHHDGLAEAHVVGETAAESKPAQKVEPAKRLELVLAQGAGERCRHGHLANAAEGFHRGARPGKRLIDVDRRLRLEQRVEQRGLGRTVSDVFSFDLSETGDPRVAAQPFLRHHPPSAVVEADVPSPRLSAARRSVSGTERPSPKSRSPCNSNQSMPDLTWSRIALRGAERRAFGLDVPALGHQRTDGAAELGDGNRVIGAGADRRKRPPEAELLQPLKGLTLCGHVPPDHSPPLRIEGCRAAVVRHDGAVVIELHARRRAHVRRGNAECNARVRPARAAAGAVR